MYSRCALEAHNRKRRRERVCQKYRGKMGVRGTGSVQRWKRRFCRGRLHEKSRESAPHWPHCHSSVRVEKQACALSRQLSSPQLAVPPPSQLPASSSHTRAAHTPLARRNPPEAFPFRISHPRPSKLSAWPACSPLAPHPVRSTAPPATRGRAPGALLCLAAPLSNGVPSHSRPRRLLVSRARRAAERRR